MSVLERRRSLPIIAACAISVAALAIFMRDASAQEAPPPVEPAPAAAGDAGAPAADPNLPDVKIIQEPAQQAVEQAAPPPNKKPAPVEAYDPAPAPKPKVKKAKPAAAPQAAPQPEPVQAEEPTPTPSSPATALGTYNPALDLEGLVLPPGTTITTAGPVNGYQALSAMSSTKTATPLEQIPQSIQVIPQTVIKDQTSLSVDEAVRNVSNVQSFNDLNIGNTDMAGSKIRGLKAEQWLDGLVVNYNTGNRDAFANVERIEILKGPAAILYGGGSGAPAAGAINVISNLPTNVAGGAFGLTYGSDSYARPYFDINQPLTADGTVLFRVTGEYTSADSFVDVLEQDRYSFNPTLTFTNKTDTTFTIQARKSEFKQQAYPGLPAVGTVAGDFRIDRHLYVGDPNIPRSYTQVEGVTVTLDHRFDDVWSFNVKSRWSHSGFDQNSQGVFPAEPDGGGPSTWQLLDTEVKQKQDEFTINPNIQAKFESGPTRNVLLMGADYSRSTDSGHMNTNYFGYDFGFGGVLPKVDLLNPVFNVPYVDPDPASPTFFSFFNFENEYVTKGLYAQLQTTLYDRVHLLGGLRWANVDVEYLEKALPVPQTFAVDDSKVLPRAGVVVDLIDGISAYASYSEGMRWAGFNQALEVKPEFSEQREVGFKFNFANKLAGTVAVFEIDRTNIPVINQGFVASLTDQHAEGFETDLVYQPNDNWQILASYGYTQAEIASGPAAGKALVEVPEHSGRLWVNYTFDPDVLRGWSVGAGIYAASSQFVDTFNIYETDAYYTVDAKIGYDAENYSVTLSAKNLTGEEYFVPYSWFGGQVAPGADRAFYGTVVYKY